jgi:hypothetical protein
MEIQIHASHLQLPQPLGPLVLVRELRVNDDVFRPKSRAPSPSETDSNATSASSAHAAKWNVGAAKSIPNPKAATCGVRDSD